MLYLIPNYKNIGESLRLCREYGAAFEYNDFFLPQVLDDEALVREKVAFYKGFDRDRSQDTLHGVFLDITVHSDDALIREASEKRIRQCMDIAAELGVRGVVFHTNMIPNFRLTTYMDNWVDRNVVFWEKILADYPTLQVFMENMFDMEADMIGQMARRMTEHPRFGICFDYAHACVFSHDIDEWADTLLPYTRHMHINDNDLHADMHWAVGSGKIDWKQFDALLRASETKPTVLIETTDLQAQERSLRYMRDNGIYPFGEKGEN